MPGLINSTAYEATKRGLCASVVGIDRAFDAAEWVMLCAESFDEFELIRNTSRGPVYACNVPETETSPGVVVIFGIEDFHGERKILILDAKAQEPEV